MPGRPPIPTVLKLLRGETRPSRLNRNEPKPPLLPGVLRCPRELTGEARKEWKRLAPILYRTGLLTPLDINGLVMYCQLWEWWTDAARHLRDEGFMTIGEDGVARKSIWSRVQSMLADQLLGLEREFGLTPASRTKIHAVPPTAYDSKAARFFGTQEPNPWAGIGHNPTDGDAS